jgi:hypothetical protein
MFKLSDRVRETSLTAGSGDIAINDTFGGFQSFASGVGSGNQTYYSIENGINFEVGLGTYTSSNTITRDIVFDSSNASGNKIDLDGGASVVFCTYPATHSVFLDKNGMMSGQLPYYSGIAFPNGLLQTRAFIGSGNTGNVSYWSDENTIGGDDKFVWSDATSEVFVDGNVSVSGNLINPTSTGNITFLSTGAYSLLHAYTNDGNNNIIALHADGGTSATWTLGLKPYSTDFVDAPTHAYVQGNTSRFSCVINDQNAYLMKYSNGFWVSHRGVDLFNVDRNNGVSIYNNSSVEVGLTINAAVSQASDLQQFKNSTGAELLSVDKNGAIVFDSQIANADAPDNSLFYSVNNDKLVFKDKNGSIHELY